MTTTTVNSAWYTGKDRRNNIDSDMSAYIGIRLYLLMSMLFTTIHLCFDTTFDFHFLSNHLAVGTWMVLIGFIATIAIGLYETFTDGLSVLHPYRVKLLVDNRHAIYMVLAMFMCIVTSAIILTVSILNIPIIAKYCLDGLIATFIGMYDILVKLKRHNSNLK